MENDVFKSLETLATKYIDRKLATNSAPQGAPSSQVYNPLWDWGAFPQAEAKPQPGAFAFNFAQISPILWLVGAVVLVLVLVGGARK